MPVWCSGPQVRSLASTFVLFVACAAPTSTGTTTSGSGATLGVHTSWQGQAQPAHGPKVELKEPLPPSAAARPVGFVALTEELGRAKRELGVKASPAPYFLSYEIFDRTDTIISASYGALVQSTRRRSRVLDTDVRVGDYHLDSTHPLRSDSFDLGLLGGARAVSMPLPDDALALRAVAWLDTDRAYRGAAEALVKIRSQQALKVAEDDPSDDFSAESPVVSVGDGVTVGFDDVAWRQRILRLSSRFRGHPQVLDSQVTLQTQALERWILNSEGTQIRDAEPYVRVSLQASARADDGMELDRFEGFDAHSMAGLPDEATMLAAADKVIADLEALRVAPLAEPYIGPAILEGRAAGVFFHEIFGHRVEGHRQKAEDEGQTFAKKIGEAVMPDFISVYDDPRLTKIGPQDVIGHYRFDDEGVPGTRAVLVDHGVLKGFLMSRSPVRGFPHSNGHGRRQEGRAVVARQGNLVVSASYAVTVEELRQRLRSEAKRQGKTYGLLFRDISGGFTNTTRSGPQAFKVLPILVYRVFTDGRPDELVRGADLVGTPLTSLTKILAAANDDATFNGYCGAESGYVPVSATSPSLLVEQIEVERKDKGNDKPPVLPAPTLRAARPAQGGAR
jgi:predicted Zn-dependent protease